MTLTRYIPLPVHAAIELAGGIALMGAPFAFGFGDAGMVTAVVIGAVLVGLALSVPSGGERGSIPLSAHHAYDFGIALALLVCAAALGYAGDPAALAVFAALALGQVLLTVNTRYSHPRA